MKTIEKIVPGSEANRSEPKINAHRLDEFGRELVDGRPMEPPLGYMATESIPEMIRRMVLQASREVASDEVESLEEANDFYVEDDPLSGVPASGYEFDEDRQLELERLIAERNERTGSTAAGREFPADDPVPAAAPAAAPDAKGKGKAVQPAPAAPEPSTGV